MACLTSRAAGFGVSLYRQWRGTGMKTNKPLEDSEVHEGPFSRDKAAHPRRGHPITGDSSMPGSTYVGRERQGRET